MRWLTTFFVVYCDESRTSLGIFLKAMKWLAAMSSIWVPCRGYVSYLGPTRLLCVTPNHLLELTDMWDQPVSEHLLTCWLPGMWDLLYRYFFLCFPPVYWTDGDILLCWVVHCWAFGDISILMAQPRCYTEGPFGGWISSPTAHPVGELLVDRIILETKLCARGDSNPRPCADAILLSTAALG